MVDEIDALRNVEFFYIEIYITIFFTNLSALKL